MIPAEIQTLVEDARAKVRAWLSDDENRSGVGDLLAAEELAAEVGMSLSLGMVKDFVEVRAEQALAGRERCGCGRLKAVLRYTTWPRKTPFGVVAVRDVYTYCRECKEAERPLCAWLGTASETWSLLVQEAAVDLASDESCAKAVAKLARHHPGVEMGRTTALRFLHTHGRRARAFIDTKLAAARALIAQPDCQQASHSDELEVEYDGGMIPVATLEPIEVPPGEEPELTPVRGLPKRRKVCRFEEVKAGLVQKPGEVDRLYSLRPTGGLEPAFDDLLGLAVLKGWTEDTQVRGIADGARYIRTRMGEAFHASAFQFILDRPHCKEHLSNAGAALERQGGGAAQEWAQQAITRLENGQVHEVVAELRAAWEASGEDEESRDDDLRVEANYFEHNADSVAYADYREQGWSTASSEVESCHNSIVQPRMKIGGAWWHPDGVDDVLALRMLRANGWWDTYWAEQRQEWRRRAEVLRAG